jgi:phosphopantothenoylcysteine decarboxylase/phosphopantothenate--cysteine ligase
MRKKLRIVISCGPTREPLDPVRFISNYSTGTLGVTLGRVCARAGHAVTLVHGPVEVPRDFRARRVPFETVLDLKDRLSREVPRCDILFMNAAVSDFKPLVAEAAKIKKGSRFLRLALVENPDVLKYLRRFKRDRVFVGFSLESKDLYRNSLRKLREKDLDLIVAQKVNERVRPFGRVSIDVMVIDRRGRSRLFRSITKERLSRLLLREAAALVRNGAR